MQVLGLDLLQPFCFHEGSQLKKEADPWRIAELKKKQRNGTPVLKMKTWTSLSNILLLDFALYEKINECYF